VIRFLVPLVALARSPGYAVLLFPVLDALGLRWREMVYVGPLSESHSTNTWLFWPLPPLSETRAGEAFEDLADMGLTEGDSSSTCIQAVAAIGRRETRAGFMRRSMACADVRGCRHVGERRRMLPP
jgi:hypothetical protein